MEAKTSIASLCRLFGKSKQSYYKQIPTQVNNFLEEEMIIEMVNKIRKRAKTSRWGGRKLHGLLKEELEGFSIKIGRDKLFSLLSKNGLLVSPRKRKYYTTQSHHWLRKYDNLIENMVVSRINQVWVSDITYVKFNQDVFYLYLITDAYSQKIVGFYISTNLKASSAVKALQMALKENEINANRLIHHSDRGVQYCSQEYIKILSKHGVLVSMTKPASPQENAIAERINGILKEEWLYDLKLKKGENPHRKINEIIKIYNEIRPHNSLNNLAPNQIHEVGFKRHNDERVIGKTYTYQRKTDKKCQPNKSNRAIVPNDYSLASCSSAELAYASSWYCKYELNNN